MQRFFCFVQCSAGPRVHGNGRITQQRFGARRGHDHAGRLSVLWIDYVITDVPEEALDRLVKNLVVADGCLQEGIPIHKSLTAANEPLLKKSQKCHPDGTGTLCVERKPHAFPITTRTEITQLPKNPRFILILPSPDPLDQCVTTEIVTRELFLFEQSPFDNGLRGNTSVIGARYPEREKTLHASGANEHIL